VLCTATANAFVPAHDRRKRFDRADEIPAFEGSEAACQCRKIRAGRVASLPGQHLHLASTGVECGVVPHDCLGQDDVQIGKPAARPRQRISCVFIHISPGCGIAWMSGKFGTPQEGGAIRYFLLWSAAVTIEGQGVPEQPQRLRPIPCLELTEGEMPAHMAMEKAVARVSGEPRG